MSTNLKIFLEQCKDAYYAGEPIISDEQYDHLEEICQEDLGVGTNRGKARHWYSMYSLKKYYIGEGDLPTFESGTVITPKLDGAAIALRYVDGDLDSVVTRGNGKHGEDITDLFCENSDHVEINLGIPINLRDDYTGQITGEVVAPEDIKNARNYAAGALGLKDPKEFEKRYRLRFFAYDMMPNKMNTYSEVLGALNKYYGFYIVGDSFCKDYPTDGSVYRANSQKEYHSLGHTSKHPRGAFAVKKRTEGIKTKIKDVIWQTGKTGKVTPVAILDPVEVDGAQVSRATLNNPGFIEALDVQIGDSVFIERAGGIIPRIIKKAE